MTTVAAFRGDVPAREESYSYLSILGRAKEALDSGHEIAVDVAQIRRYPNQPRKYFNPDGIRRLSESIDASGQTTPGIIRAHPDGVGYELIDGERRWRAISAIKEVRRPLYKAKLIEAEDDVIQYLISGIANFNREGHTVLETMETIDRLLRFEFPMEEIAALLGISEVWANNIHGLNRLVPEVQSLLDESISEKKRLPVTAAIQISKVEGKLQSGLAQRVLNREIPLANLRTEVVAVAKSHGSYIRERKVEPRQKWAMARSNVALAKRKVAIVHELLQDADVRRYLRIRSTEQKETLELIEEVSKNLLIIKNMILEPK